MYITYFDFYQVRKYTYFLKYSLFLVEFLENSLLLIFELFFQHTVRDGQIDWMRSLDNSFTQTCGPVRVSPCEKYTSVFTTSKQRWWGIICLVEIFYIRCTPVVRERIFGHCVFGGKNSVMEKTEKIFQIIFKTEYKSTWNEGTL